MRLRRLPAARGMRMRRVSARLRSSNCCQRRTTHGCAAMPASSVKNGSSCKRCQRRTVAPNAGRTQQDDPGADAQQDIRLQLRMPVAACGCAACQLICATQQWSAGNGCSSCWRRAFGLNGCQQQRTIQSPAMAGASASLLQRHGAIPQMKRCCRFLSVQVGAFRYFSMTPWGAEPVHGISNAA